MVTACSDLTAGVETLTVSVKVVRRARLPADRYTPAAARALVQSVVRDARLDRLLDEALLLTTELATNGVIHAGTEIDVEAVAEQYGLTVTVTDYRPALLPVQLAEDRRRPGGATTRDSGPADGDGRADLTGLTTPEAPMMPVELAEHGRGLALIHHFATSWGTVHRPDGKAVWFRLSMPGVPAELPHPAAGPMPTSLSPDTLEWLTRPETTGTDRAGVMSLAAELLRRLCAVTGATGARVEIDQADMRGNQLLAAYGHQARAGRSETRAAVPVSRPWRGDLILTTNGPEDPYTVPLAHLVAARVALMIEKERFRDTSMRRRSWLMYLAEVSELLAQSLDVELTLALIPRLLVPRLGQWCVVHRTDEWGDPHVASAVHRDEDELPALLAALAKGGPGGVGARLRAALRGGVRIALPAPIDGYTMPLIARGQPLGTLTIGGSGDHWMDPDEAAVAEDVARRCALALDNARIHADRNHVAQTLQQALLPSALPVVGGISLAAQYVPSAAGVEVGGDFYDVLPLPDDRWLLVIGDVSGKGVQAAAVTGLVRNVIRVLVRDNKPVPELLSRLNETLIERGGGRYCTLALATIGPGGGAQRDIQLYLAGHERPILLHDSGRTSLVGLPGTALGLLEAVVSPPASIALNPGDSLIFYTDGITERRRGSELFGLPRLESAAGRLGGLPAEAVVARLRATVMAFSPEPPRDDIAILALRNQPAGETR